MAEVDKYVRLATLEDLKEILKLSKQSEYTKKLSEVRYLQEYIPRKEFAVFHTGMSGVQLGFVLIRNLVRKPYTSIYYMGTRVDVRGLGIGYRLLQWVEQQSPHKEIHLGVDEANIEGQAWWARQGFQPYTTTTTKRGSIVLQLAKTIR